MPASNPKSAPHPIDRRRRRHARYRVEFPVTVAYLLGSHYQKLEGHGRDMSEAGIGILLAAELTGGEVASLTFTIPGSDASWEVRGVVRHRRGYHYGFEFLALTDKQREALNNHLRGLTPID